jgi:GTP cyclohydrolase IV
MNHMCRKCAQESKVVEDYVRTMAKNIVTKFSHLSDDAVIMIKQINEESIHRHNDFAEMVSLIGELRSEIARG